VLFAARPGLGRQCRLNLRAADVAALLAALEADGCWSSLDAVFTGYFPSPASVRAAARGIAAIRAANRDAVVCVDPILGDDGALYVGAETATAIRDELLPLATIATPNLFELGWLSGGEPADLAASAVAARRLGPSTVLVTSAPAADGEVATLLITPAAALARSAPHMADLPHGAGDLFAGLFLAHLLLGKGAEAALDAAMARLIRVLRASRGHEVLDLSALAADSK
jgi:pyridoxine kinase